MTEPDRTDDYTGKPTDKFQYSDWVGKPNGQYCDDCGTELIDKCPVCHAPVCCPQCCSEEEVADNEAPRPVNPAHEYTLATLIINGLRDAGVSAATLAKVKKDLRQYYGENVAESEE